MMHAKTFCFDPHLIATTTLLALGFQIGFLNAEETGTLSVNIINAVGDPLPCRAWISHKGKNYFKPQRPLSATPYARDQSFSCDGEFEIELPVGPAVLHVEKGKEWFPRSIPVEIRSSASTQVTVPLEPWIDMESKGYYSTDLHIHFGNNDPQILQQLGKADDLDVVPAFTYWLRGTEAEWETRWPEPLKARVLLNSSPHITLNNIEIERISSRARPGGSIGASFLFNLEAPLSTTSYSPHYPTDTDLCLLARATSPHVVIDTDKPSWAETVVGAILGAYDTVQVCHNHNHRNQTLAGGWGMIGPLNEDERSLGEKNELFHRTNQHYYSFLNCGIRLGVSGGSAIGVMPVPTGYNRVYASVDGPFTIQKFWQSIRKGRSFATSGPILFLAIDSRKPGAHIAYDSNRKMGLGIQASVHSREALSSLELIHNGRVIRQVQLNNQVPNPSLRFDCTFQHNPTRSGWYAARVIYESPIGQLRQAHTSPIYITVNNKPTASRKDAEYLIDWIDTLIEIAKTRNRFPSSNQRDEVLNTYNRARNAYEGVAQIAKDVWSD